MNLIQRTPTCYCLFIMYRYLLRTRKAIAERIAVHGFKYFYRSLNKRHKDILRTRLECQDCNKGPRGNPNGTWSVLYFYEAALMLCRSGLFFSHAARRNARPSAIPAYTLPAPSVAWGVLSVVAVTAAAELSIHAPQCSALPIPTAAENDSALNFVLLTTLFCVI